MRVTPALEVLWQSAGRAAVSEGLDAIEPEHFLLALVALAVEPPEHWTPWLPGGPVSLPGLLEEADAVREAFRERRLDPVEIGRRAASAPQGRVPRGGKPHLAHECEAALQRAAQLAEGESARTSARHLLEAFFEQPPPSLREILHQTEAAPAAGDNRTLAARAVVDLLRDAQRWSVVLIGEPADTRAVVEAVSRTLSVPGRGGRRLVPTSTQLGGNPASPGVRDAVLVFPSIAEIPTNPGSQSGEWSAVLRAASAEGRQWLACLTPAEYAFLEAARPTKSLHRARVVWLHPRPVEEVPWEL